MRETQLINTEFNKNFNMYIILQNRKKKQVSLNYINKTQEGTLYTFSETV